MNIRAGISHLALLFLLLCSWGLPASVGADIAPSMKYECQAIVTQDLLRGAADHVYAKTKKFLVTEKELSAPVKLTQNNFTEFFGIEPEQGQDDKGKPIVWKGQKTFKGSDLSRGFEVTISPSAEWKDGKFISVRMDSKLTVDRGRKFVIGPKKVVDMIISKSDSGRPPELENYGEIDLNPKDKTKGSVHFALVCTDVLAKAGDPEGRHPGIVTGSEKGVTPSGEETGAGSEEKKSDFATP